MATDLESMKESGQCQANKNTWMSNSVHKTTRRFYANTSLSLNNDTEKKSQ